MFWEVYNWVALHGWQAVTTVIALVTLYYAVLAYRSSNDASRTAQAAIELNLKMKAEAALADADRSMLYLQNACNANRIIWQQYNDKQPTMLGSSHFGKHGSLFSPSPEFQAIHSTEDRGAKLLAGLKQAYAKAELTDAHEINLIIREASNTGIQIERLAHRLELPKQYHH